MENGRSREIEILYHSSQDVWKASDVHDMCDNKGEIITLIRNNGGLVFCVLSDKPCTSNEVYLPYDQ